MTDLRAWLCGRWRLERQITQAEGGGAAQGEAVFAPDGAALIYDETAILRLPAGAFTATRRYVFRFPEAGRALVFFDDGRPFHDLRLTERPFAVRHDCGEDVYDGLFAREGEDGWRSEWRVAGPRKSYLSVTRYRRA